MAGLIHREKKQTEFVLLDTHALRNPQMSWKAKGLYAYIMQLPDDWKINIADLSNRSTDGRDSTAGGLKELVNNGYVVRVRCLKSDGTFDGYDYHFFERPEQALAWRSTNGLSVYGKPVNGKPVNGLSVNGKSVATKEEETKGLKQLNIFVTENETTGSAENLDLGKPEKPYNKFSYTAQDVAAMLKTSQLQSFFAQVLANGSWADYLDFKREKKADPYRSAKSEALGVGRFFAATHGNAEIGQQVVDQSRANGWTGLFELKTEKYANGQNGNHTNSSGNSDFFGGSNNRFFQGA